MGCQHGAGVWWWPPSFSMLSRQPNSPTEYGSLCKVPPSHSPHRPSRIRVRWNRPNSQNWLGAGCNSFKPGFSEMSDRQDNLHVPGPQGGPKPQVPVTWGSRGPQICGVGCPCPGVRTSSRLTEMAQLISRRPSCGHVVFLTSHAIQRRRPSPTRGSYALSRPDYDRHEPPAHPTQPASSLP